MTESEAPEKELTRAQLRRKADQKAIKIVHAFMKQYSELADDDDQGHAGNEEMLINGLYNIYDPEPEDGITIKGENT